MPKILIRSGKDPFTPVSAESTLAQNVLNTNTGNLLFAYSVHRALSTPGTEVVSNSYLSERRKATAADAARINEEFDQFVVPLANAFRPDFARQLDWLASLIEQLEIPVVVVGVGAQTGPDLDLESLSPITPVVRRFVTAVLERSASIGVRGAFTADFLTGLGFPSDAVDVIGCPSLFLHGPDFRLSPVDGALAADGRIALNVTPRVDGLAELVERLVQAHPRLVYVGQHHEDLRLLVWGETPEEPVDPRLPLHPAHRLHVEDRVRFPLDGWSWIDYLRNFDFAVGTRFHGNVAATLADTPAMLLVHDSRTVELAELHGLPHRRISDLPADVSAEALHSEYDPSAFNEAYPSRFDSFLEFLERNGLDHVYSTGDTAEFDAKVAAASFPPLVRPLHSSDADEIAARLRWLRDGQAFDSAMHRQAYRQPFRFPKPRERSDRHKKEHRSAATRIAKLEKQLERAQARGERQRARLDQQAERLHHQAARIDALEARLAASEDRSLLRRARRRLLAAIGRG